MIKSFKIGAVTWTIEVNNDKLNDREAYGLSVYDESIIYIQNTTLNVFRQPEAVEQAIYHEVVHAILDTLGENELSCNEKFVKKFSLLLHQFEKTKQE